ncbi:MAG TPA: PAS domain S-box protein [Gemmatimonadaceae bacterium]|nr:PAS domain S-box protein [Gemmatimonadaceae bacterium]
MLWWATEVGSAALLLTAATLFWTLRLQRLVGARTAELERKNQLLEKESADRRQALEALQLSDSRLRMAMEAAQLRTWHWDVAADRFDVVGERNPEMGPPLPAAGAALQQFLKPVHEDDLFTVREALMRTIQSGEPLGTTFRVVLPDGSVRWKVARGCAVRDANGGVASLVGVVLDVTDRFRNEEELNASEERYCELFENANDIIYTHDLTGRFTSINKAAERLLGYSHADALRMNVGDVVVPEQVDTAQQMVARKVAGDVSSTEYELDVIAKSGRRVTLEVNTRLIRRNDTIVGVQGIARDVTERKRLEWQLGQSQKMEAVGQLAGGIAHDFNNLLTAILGNAQLASLSQPMSGELRECLTEIAGASHRAAALTRQLLVFSRQEQIDRRPVSLASTLNDFMRMLRRIIGEHIEVKLAIAPGVPSVLADPAQIEQVVLNLAVNARDAMPNGGRLEIDVDEVTLSEPAGPAAEIPAGRYVRLRFADTGCGIRADVRQRIFEPFFTTKPVGEGTGLGLAVVYGIVRQHDGYIDVVSALGEGTRFTVFLPAIEREAPAAVEPVQGGVVGGRETILVAEDEVSLRRLTERLLTGLGYSVIVAEDGVQALELFTRRRAEIDLLLLDIVMPGKGGKDVHAAVRALGSDVPVVFMTGYSADVAPHALGTDTGCRVLCKPYDLDALASVVRDVLEGAGV